MFGSLILIWLAICLLFFLVRTHRAKNFPPGPLALPFFGNLLHLNLENPIADLEKLSVRYGKVFSLFFGGRPAVILNGTKAMREALVTKATDFAGRPNEVLLSHLTQGKGVIMADYGPGWREHRRFALTTLRNFGLGKQSMEQRILGETQHVAAVLENNIGKSVDPQTLFHNASCDIICSIMFGARYDYDHEFFQAMIKMMSDNSKIANGPWGMIYDTMPLLRALPLPFQNPLKAYTTIKHHVSDIIEQHRASRTLGQPRDVIDSYLDQMEKRRSEGGSVFDEDQMVVMLLDLLFAGTDTTSNTIRFTVLYLMTHSEIQERCHQEIDQALEDKDHVSFEDRHKMPYMQAVIQEAQRFSSTLPLSVYHSTTKDTELMGYHIPKVDELEPLQNFLSWCDKVGLTLNSKVYVTKEGTVAEYGMLAKADIEEGEVLFTIPRSALLHHGTSKVSALLDQEKASLENSSGWVPLLLALLYEYTTPQSHWAPYLSLWTDFSTLDHPMFWPKEERDRLLRGTGVPEAVDKDLANIQKEYTDVVLPFISTHPDLWNPNTHTLELYTRLVAFVMAYSFQEPLKEEDEEEEEEEERAPNPPMMVPMADMLNHVSKHNANLEYTSDSLKMVCVRPIAKGEEVFNTFGQMANWQLLHMYGFTEPYPTNTNETADIPTAVLYKAVTQGVQSDLDRQLLEEMWKMLCEMMGETRAFIFSRQGCLTETELHTTLKVFCMSKEEFCDFRENEGWEEDEEDDEKISQAFSSDGLPSLKAPWRWLIHEAARLTLDSYGEGKREEKGPVIDRDQALMEDKALLAQLSSRQQRALQVRYGQKSILYKLMELTSS